MIETEEEQQAIADFKYWAIQVAKTLPISDARSFLKGLLLCASEDLSDIRAAHHHLCNVDDQLELTQGLAASRLGVTREHLNRVLRGHRQSKSLMQRYRQIVREIGLAK